MSLIHASQLVKLSVLLIIAPLLSAQDDPNWPSLSYLRSDYKAVSVVAHVRIEKAEITNRVGGYENWKINAVVIESFKGTLKKGDEFEYFHGAEAGFKQEYFAGEKIVFLLSERGKERAVHYSVLENSTLPYTEERVAKLRSIQRSLKRRRSR